MFEILNIIPTSNAFPISNQALERKKRVKDLGYIEMKGWETWTLDQKRLFKKHCGDIMSKYYPNVDLRK